MVYYNENDPKAAAWLNQLIRAGVIADGIVDTQSIEDVIPSDLTQFSQCHFFAGIGGWSYALRLAGWPDDQPVWTGSCPCQPFSAAGKGDGFADERHLWPSWFWLIQQEKPPIIFGEQVEAAIRHGWLDLVQDDLEGEGYTCEAVGLPVTCAARPHERKRLYFVAHSDGSMLARSITTVCPIETRQTEIERRALATAISDHSLGSKLARHQHVRQPMLQSGDDGLSARVGRLRGYGNAIVPQVAAEVIKAYLATV